MSPRTRGRPIAVVFRPALRARRGKLLSGPAARGAEVHAASFLRARRIVLDSALLSRPRELARILIHELFHFVWLRLGNPRRRSWEQLLRREIAAQAAGELGWSAELAKSRLTHSDRLRRSRRWREYLCESFCDSAAYLFGPHARHAEFTLPPPARRARLAWFAATRLTREISL